MAQLSAAQIYQLARGVGFPPVEAALMTAIALRESSGVTTAWNDNYKEGGRDNSSGLWQINTLPEAHGNRYGSVQDLFDPQRNARAAFDIWQRAKQAWGDPWKPWRTDNGPFASTNFAAAAAGTGGEVSVEQMNATAGQIAGGGYQSPDITASGGQFTSFETPPAELTDDEIIAKIQNDYGGAFSWALSDPELRNILIEGVRGGWDENRIAAAVQNTQLYRTTSDAQRAWMSTYSNNPGEAARQVRERIGDVRRLSRYLGVSLSQERLQLIAWNSLSFGWQGEQLQRAVLDEANWTGKHIGEFGQIGATVTQVKQLAESYGLTLERDKALRLARDILSGSATIDSLTGGFKTQAKALFPAFAKDIDAGMRLSDIAQPYMQTAAQLLEVNPATMRLTDPKWAAPLTRRQNGTPSPMSLDEWTTHVMSDKKYGWDRTDNAMAAAANLVDEIGTMFGGF